MKKLRQSQRHLDIKGTNICNIGVPEGEEKKKGLRKYVKRLQL